MTDPSGVAAYEPPRPDNIVAENLELRERIARYEAAMRAALDQLGDIPASYDDAAVILWDALRAG